MNRVDSYVYELIEKGLSAGTRSFPATDELPEQIIEVWIDGNYAQTKVLSVGEDGEIDIDIDCEAYDSPYEYPRLIHYN